MSDPLLPHTLPLLRQAGWRELLCWWLGRRHRIIVQGASMQPLLYAQDDVLMTKRAPRVGDIVIAQHPFKQVQLIKLVETIEPAGCWLVGMNPGESTDSRTLGFFPIDSIQGVVTSRLPSVS